MGRGFVGLCSDSGSREYFFVSNAGSSSVARLLTHHTKNWQHKLEPLIQLWILDFAMRSKIYSRTSEPNTRDWLNSGECGLTMFE
jgi:hypothetical protein